MTRTSCLLGILAITAGAVPGCSGNQFTAADENEAGDAGEAGSGAMGGSGGTSGKGGSSSGTAGSDVGGSDVGGNGTGGAGRGGTSGTNSGGSQTGGEAGDGASGGSGPGGMGGSSGASMGGAGAGSGGAMTGGFGGAGSGGKGGSGRSRLRRQGRNRRRWLGRQGWLRRHGAEHVSTERAVAQFRLLLHGSLLVRDASAAALPGCLRLRRRPLAANTGCELRDAPELPRHVNATCHQRSMHARRRRMPGQFVLPLRPKLQHGLQLPADLALLRGAG